MKKSTTASVMLAVCAILALCALAAFLTWQYRENLAPAQSDKIESEADAAMLALSETVGDDPAAAAVPGTERTAAGQTGADRSDPGRIRSEKAENDPAEKDAGDASTELTAAERLGGPSVIWVGDSRTLGMQNAVDSNDLFIAAAGEGYDWFVADGLPQLKDALRVNPDLPVVFNLGVNDYDNMDLYLDLYVSLTEEYPDTCFYFLSINPIDPEICHNITNEEISDFNSHLCSLFPDTYLDSYTPIMANEITPIDGIHYSKEDYRFIYKYVSGQIAPDGSAHAR